MCRPEDCDSTLAPHRQQKLEQVAAARRIEPDCRLIHQQHAWLVQERARKLHPASITAAEGRGLAMGAIGQTEPRELVGDTRVRFRARHAVQPGVEQEIGRDGELEVERRLLEHDAKPGERRHRVARHVVAHDLDAPGIRQEQSGEELEQCRLAGAVGTKQRNELARLRGQADAIQRLYRAVALHHLVEEEGRGVVHVIHRHWPLCLPLVCPFSAVGLPHRFDRAYAGSNRRNSQAERKPVLIDRRAFSLAVLPLALSFTVAPSAAKDTGLIFVSNEKSNNLIVIDPKTLKVIKDIKVSRRPRDMHFSTDHTKLYVACGDDDVIDILDVAKLEVIGRIPTGPSPETFSIDERKRRIYVSNEEGSSLSIIDMDQAITIQEVPTGAEPEGVFVSEDGKIVYVTSEVGDLIHMIDADGGHVIQDVVVGTRPRRFAATPDRKELWVTTELSGEVYIIDREKFEVSGKIEFLPPGMRKSDVTPVGLAMTKDGKTAFVTLGHAAHVAVVDVPTRKILSYILVGKRSWGVTLSRDERTMFVANGFGDDITVIDVRSRKATVSIPVGRIPWGVIIDE